MIPAKKSNQYAILLIGSFIVKYKNRKLFYIKYTTSKYDITFNIINNLRKQITEIS